MSQDDVLLNAGKEQGEFIAAYLIRRMHEGRITPTEAVNVVAAHVEKQAEEMVAAGTPQQDILRWLQGLRETVPERFSSPVPDRSTRSIPW
jgi:hypothetical protein